MNYFPAAHKQSIDKFYGRKEISVFAQESVTSLFVLPHPAKLQEPTISTWFAYLLYRTSLPDSHVFLALHLLRRVSDSFLIDVDAPTPLLHHRLLLAATILATKYLMDDAFSNKSFGIASRNLFSGTAEIDAMEFSLFESLGFRIRDESEDLGSILSTYQLEWEERLAVEQEERRKSEEEERRKSWEKFAYDRTITRKDVKSGLKAHFQSINWVTFDATST